MKLESYDPWLQCLSDMVMHAGKMCRMMWGLPSSTSPLKGRWAEGTFWRSKTNFWHAGSRWLGSHSSPIYLWVGMCLCLWVSYQVIVLCTVIGAGVGDRGAAAPGSLPEHDRGPGSSLHGAQHAFQWGGVFGRVPPAPQQGIHVWKQACQRSTA